MADNSIQVEAKVDTSQLKSGLHEAIAAVSEAVGEIKAQFSEVAAATSKAFDFIDSFTKFIDGLKKSVLEVSRLSETTGIGVAAITELKDAMEAAGVSTERLPMQLTKLAKAIEATIQGSTQQAEAFRSLGVETDGWAQKAPSAVAILEQISDHLAGSHDKMRDLSNMSVIFGRGVVQLTAWLSEGSEEVRKQKLQFVEHGLQMQKSADAAKQLQREETSLKTQLETEMLPVFRGIVDALHEVQKGVIGTRFVIQAMAGVGIVSARAIGTAFMDLKDLMTSVLPSSQKRSFDKMTADVQQFARQLVQVVKEAELQGLKDMAALEQSFKTAGGNTGDDGDEIPRLNKTKEQIIDLTHQIYKRGVAEREVAKEIKNQADAEEEAARALIHLNNTMAAEAGKVLDEQRRVSEVQEEAAKNHIEAVKAIELQHLDFQRQIGAISESDYEQQLQRLLQKTAAEAQEELRIKLSAANQGTAEYARILAEIQRLEDKSRIELEHAEHQSYLRRNQALLQFVRQAQNINQQLQASFFNVVNGMNQSLAQFVTTGKANWASLASSAITSILDIALRSIEADIIMALSKTQFFAEVLALLGIHKAVHKTSAHEEAQSSAHAAAAHTLADVPYPANIPAAVGVEALGMGFAAATMLEVGSWKIPDTMPAILHPGEMVVPAFEAGLFRQKSGLQAAAENTLARGDTFHISPHFIISTVDADSFDGLYQRKIRGQMKRDLLGWLDDWKKKNR